MISKKNRIYFSLIIFLGIFCLLGLPFTQWWLFGADDFHALYLGYRVKTWKDLFHFFYEGNAGQLAGPSNYIQPTGRPAFFTAYYRPIYHLLHTAMYKFFGTNGYGFHLTNVFFHALNTTILFNIFLWFIAPLPALLSCLLFAFHPQIAYRFGALVNMHYYVNVTLVLLCFLSLKEYLDTKNIRFHLLAIILFALSLFTRETTVVLPGIIFLGTYLYQTHFSKISFLHFFKHFISILQTTSAFFVTVISFLALRLYLYPLKLSNNSSKTFNVLNWVKTKIPELQVFIYDCLTLSWLPWGHKAIRGIIVITLLSFLLWLFLRNRKKIYVLYFLFAAGAMLWPALVGPYSPRYFYESYPFILVALILLFAQSHIKLNAYKKSGYSALSLVVVFYASFCFENFSRREQKMHTLSSATYKLVQNPLIKSRALCFLGHPLDAMGDQTAPLFWILFDNPELPVYFDGATSIMQADSNVVQTTKWRNIISEFFPRNYHSIEKIKDGFRFTSHNPKKVFFTIDDRGYSVGRKKINKTTNNGNIIEFELNIDEKYKKNNPMYITWDYDTKEFIVL